MINITNYVNKITKAAGIFFIGLVLSKFFAYLYIILLSRLGSSIYGLLTLGFTIVSFLSVLTLMGLKPAILRYVAFYKGKNDERRIKGTIITSIIFSLPFSIITSLLLLIFSEQIAIQIFHNPNLTLVLRILAFIVPIRVLSKIFLSSMQAFQRIKYNVLIGQLTENVVRLVLTFILILLGYNLLGPIFAFIIASLITLVLSFYFLEKKVFPIVRTKVKSIYNHKAVIIFALPLLFSSFLIDVVKWLDSWFIGFFKTASEVGLYNVGLPTANLLIIIPTSLIVIFAPLITELYAKGKISEVKSISKLVSKWIFFLNIPIVAFLIIFSKQILGVVFGTEYIGSYMVVIILALGHIFYSLNHVPISVLQTIKRTKLIFFVFLISTIINIILNFILIPVYGIMGAAIGTLCYFFSMYLLMSIFVFRFKKMQFLKWIYLKSVASIIIASFFIIQIAKWIKPDSIIKLLIISLILFLIYSLLVVILKSLEEEDNYILGKIKDKLFNIKKFKF